MADGTKKTARGGGAKGAAAETTTAPTTNDELVAKLKEFDVADEVIAKIKDELGATTVADLSQINEADLIGVGMKPIPARNLLKGLAPGPTVTAAGGLFGNLQDVLPAAPSEESWLKALRTGGVLKVDQSSVIAAVRAALAHRAGLFMIPKKLVDQMEQFADSVQEQVDPTFFAIRSELTRRSYAEIFEAVPGLDGSYVTKERKDRLFDRVDKELWPAIISFQGQLKTWYEEYMGPGNQAMRTNSILARMTGQAIPGGIDVPPPPTDMLRARAEDVNNAVNKVFAGTGVQIAAALAYEASQICKTLENSRLPAMIGANNRDQMLKQLGVGVSSAYPRMEESLVRYIIAVFEIENVPVGMDNEANFFYYLYQLGAQIQLEEVGGTASKITGIGGSSL